MMPRGLMGGGWGEDARSVLPDASLSFHVALVILYARVVDCCRVDV